MIVYLNGEWVEDDEAVVPVADRGFLFADGVFETALLYRGRYFHLTNHLERFQASAATLGIPAPSTLHLAEIAHDIARRNALSDGSLRITLTAGVRASEYGTLVVTISPRDDAWVQRARDGWRIVTAQTRRPSTRAVPAHLKALGRTYALLARREARVAQVDDALLLTDDDFVCEGPSWNIMWCKGRDLFTPALDLGVLAGITRSILLGIADEMGYATNEGHYPRSALDDADEIFATMTSVGIARIVSLDGKMMSANTPVADELYARYWSHVADATAE
jgi:branched-chain amino acid aminotransferase